jgi:hypothetical protein
MKLWLKREILLEMAFIVHLPGALIMLEILDPYNTP